MARAERLFLVLAMKRSGHHAVIDWIADNCGGAKHVNNAVFGWENGIWSSKRGSAEADYGRPRCIVNLEDFDIQDWQAYRFDTFAPFLEFARVDVILVLRSFENWLASSVQRRHTNERKDVWRHLECDYTNGRGDPKPGRIELWARQLQEFANPTIKGLISVSFDQFIALSSYRRALADRLLLRNRSGSLAKVARFGGGSSFDGLKHADSASAMAVLSRGSDMRTDSEYLRLAARYADLSLKSKAHVDVVGADSPE